MACLGRSHTARRIPRHWLDAPPEAAARFAACRSISPPPSLKPPRGRRAMEYQESERAKQIENPGMRGPVENAAERYAALAEKFETVRKRA